MVEAWLYTILSVIVVSLISLIGVFTISIRKEILKEAICFLVSFAVGGLFGDVFLHLLPESFEKLGVGPSPSLLILFGILLFFGLEKFIRWRHCHDANCKEHSRPVSAMILIGDGVHNFFDGILIAASYLISIPLGIATAVAVILHEIPQEIGNFGVLLRGGFSINKALFFNFLSALTAILGALISLIIGSRLAAYSSFLLPITAGGFIYIAGSDLIPELHHEIRPLASFRQFTAIILGIGLMFLLTFLD